LLLKTRRGSSSGTSGPSANSEFLFKILKSVEVTRFPWQDLVSGLCCKKPVIIMIVTPQLADYSVTVVPHRCS